MVESPKNFIQVPKPEALKLNFKIISPLLAVLTLAGCSPAMVDAYTRLQQECAANVGTEVDGVFVASESFMLVSGQQIAVGGAPLGEKNIVTSDGQGGFTFKTADNDIPTTIVEDGRVIAEKTKAGFNVPSDKLTISHFRVGNYTQIDVTMNCKDPTAIPPIIRANNGFSPIRNGSKPSPMAYGGFGH